MAVGLRLKFAGATEEQYEAMHRHMNMERDPPAGLILHSGAPIDDGWAVVDYWESREAFDRFAAERLGPAVEHLADQGPPRDPDVEEFPVHNLTRPWLLRWGKFSLSANSPALVRARGAVARLSSSLSRSPGPSGAPTRGPLVAADTANQDHSPANGAAEAHLVAAGAAVADHPGEGAGGE